MVSREGVDGRCAAGFSRVIEVEDVRKGSIAHDAGSQQAKRLESTTVLGFNMRTWRCNTRSKQSDAVEFGS